MPVHPSAQSGFAAAATQYERGRPDYPGEAVEWMSDHLGLGPGKTVLDLGAGTGKLTRALQSTGARVLALEPVSEMAAILRQTAPQAEVVKATAERTGLADGSVAAATAGQSFHWFANPLALSEIRRVLRTRGGLGLIWNRRDLSYLVWAEIDRLIEPLRRTEPTYRDHAWRPVLDGSGLFSPLLGANFVSWHSVSPEELVDRVVSISFVACLPQADREQIAGEVLTLGRRCSQLPGGRLALPYATEAWVAYAID
ncbi:MAG: class I SAM-dependent methyltransferase [Candidatus Dormibacteria bacterium]